MNSISKIWAHLRHEGLMRTLARGASVVTNRWSSWRDGAMDRKYGIDTRGIVEAYETDHVGEHGSQSTGHEPIQRLLFLEMIKRLPVDVSNYTFVDFGSGKGRAVILAAHFPFQRVLGIEFSPTLNNAAKQNIAKFTAARTGAPKIDLRCEDAALSVLPATPLICFFYNPFGPEVMRKVLDNIRDSVDKHPREVLLIYRNPVHADLFDASEGLSLAYSTRDYRVYKALSTSRQ